MNEKPQTPAGGVPLAGGNQSQPVPAANATAPGAGAQPSAPMVKPAVALSQSPGLFGGHKGGGKKRADGLVAGSEAAKAVDREKNRVRMAEKRSGEKVAGLPPPLPNPKTQVANPGAPLPGVSPVDGGPVVGAPVGAAAFPTFVAWSQKMLERPTKLLTRIFDRMRVGALMDRVQKLQLPKDIEAEAEKRMRYKDEQIADFNAALSTCAVIELNKRTVPGAQHSHWLELAMTGGELVNCHLDTVDWLEKQILAKAEAEKAKAEAPSNVVAKAEAPSTVVAPPKAAKN